VKHLSFLFIYFCLVNSYSQETALTNGGEINSSAGGVSYSIGQMFFELNNSDSTSFNHGVQQPLQANRVNLCVAEKVIIQVYPNPATEQIVIELDIRKGNDFSYSLFNLYGMKILTSSIIDDVSIVQINGLPPATYFLIVFDHFIQVGTYRIVKI
jgi:hypothetical protein